MTDARCDVAVVGAGLAGLLLARRLAGESVDVQILHHDAAPAPASERSLGIAARGGMDSPWRLAQGLGEERAGELWRYSGRAVDRLVELTRELGLTASEKGSWRVALEANEWRELRDSVPLLNRWYGAGSARALAGTELDPHAIGAQFEGAIHVAGDAQIPVAALLEALRRELADRTIPLLPNALRISDAGPGTLELDLGDGRRLSCELLVVAAGVGSPAVHPFFGPMLIPVRLQGLRTLPVPSSTLDQPVLARHRFEAWHQNDDGAVSFVGSRWAEQPEMEAGVTDDEALSDKVSARQDEFLQRHLPEAAAAGVATRWSGIVAYGCDGLPLVGPIPGNPRIHGLCGWGGWGLSWIAAAADDVADAIVGSGDPVTVPAPLRARRMT